MPIEDKIEQIKERSEYTVEMLGKTPPFLIRAGMYIFFIFIAVIFVLCFFIKYPDVVVGRIVLTSQNPTVRVIWPISGKIARIYAKDKDLVKKDSILVVVENTANLEDVYLLKKFIIDVQNTDPALLSVKTLKRDLKLGSLQNLYADLIENINIYTYTINDNDIVLRKSSLLKQIKQIEDLNASINKQEDILSRQTRIAQSNYKRNAQLFEQGVVSASDLEILESNQLQYQRDLENISTQIINNDIRINQLRSQLVEMMHQKEETTRTRLISIKEKTQTIRAAIEEWEKTYVIKSPIDGHISFHGIWSNNQYVNANEDLFDIVPINTAKSFGKITIAEQNSGKIRVGQKAIIKLDGYNYREFGVVNGYVKSISLTPIGGFYTIYVELPEKMLTTHDKVIGANQEIQGVAEIVTEDLRLIDRIFYTIRSVFKQ